MIRIVVVGELNPDLIMAGYRAFPTLGQEVLVDNLTLTLGSASAIAAMGLARLGNQVRFAGLTGCDLWGEFCSQVLGRAGIDVAYLKRDPAVKTGLTISITSASDRALVTYLGTIASFRAEDLDLAALDGCNHLHISSYFLQEGLRPGCRRLLSEAHARGLTTSLDPGFDPANRWDDGIRDTLQEVDVFFPNDVELSGLGGADDPEECLGRLDNGHTLVVAKLGAAGCLTLERGNPLYVPAFRVTPVDTTGAGDSFNAGFLHAWLRGKPLVETLRFAAACGALSTRAMGGTGSQAAAEEAEAMLYASGN